MNRRVRIEGGMVMHSRTVKRWAINLTTLLFLSIALALRGPATALAAAGTFTQSTVFPFHIDFINPCNGEEVLLSANLHDLFQTTLDGRGGLHLEQLQNPQGVSGVSASGTKYQATGEARSSFNGTVGSEITYVNNFRIIAHGDQQNNFLLHQLFHITVNANGTVTAYVDNFSVTCR
jgi:hypothetical protein